MKEVIEKLKKDYPDHSFEEKEQEGTKILVIDGDDSPLTWTKAKNIEEGASEESKKEAEKALYEVLKMEVNKVINDKKE